jgi:hypothetical protein
MPTINVDFSENEFEQLTQARGKESWHDFIMSLATPFTCEDKTEIVGELIVRGSLTVTGGIKNG